MIHISDVRETRIGVVRARVFQKEMGFLFLVCPQGSGF